MTLVPFFIFCICALSSFAFGQEEEATDGKIEIDYPVETEASYKERRQNWGFIFGVAAEQILPTKFRSKIDTNPYSTLFADSPMNAGQLELGLKYNFMLGSIGASVLYGNGGAQNGKINDGRSLNLTKKAVQLTYTMDNLFDTPYAAPYGGAQVVTWDWVEYSNNPGIKESGSTQVTGGITVGMLFQLDWLVPNEALEARNSSGVENTFLDVFVTQYNASDGKADQNFQTGLNYGVGLKVEY
jgi:hypothetical protein